MESEFRHTQYGILMFVVFIISGILIAVVALAVIAENRWGSAVAMVGIYILGLVLFYSFSVEISDGKLNFWFGIGLIRKSYAIHQVQSARVVHNPWYYFWGVKSIPGGWLYAIAPGKAVEIIFNNGNMIRLGTNQPERLKDAMDLAIQQVGNH